MSRVPTPFSCNPLAGNIFLGGVDAGKRSLGFSKAKGWGGPWKGLNSEVQCCFRRWPQKREVCPDLVLAQGQHLPSRCADITVP